MNYWSVLIIAVLFSLSVISSSLQPHGQASLSFTISQRLFKLISIESVMPSSRLVLCHPLLLLPFIFPIRVFSNVSTLQVRWPKYWSFSFSISLSNEYSGLISFKIRSSLVAQMVKHLSAMQETRVRSLGQEDPVEKETAAHSSTLAWKIPYMEEPNRLQSTGWQRVRHDWEMSLSLHFSPHILSLYLEQNPYLSCIKFLLCLLSFPDHLQKSTLLPPGLVGS